MRRAFVSVVVVGALVATGLATTAAPASAARNPRPTPQVEPSIGGHRATPVSLPKAAAAAAPGTATVTWPRAGHADVSLPQRAAATSSKTPLTRAGTLPVWVNKTASVDVLDHSAAIKAGASGLLMRVHVAGRVSVRVSYSAFRHAYGGDWAARLRLVQLPACAATTPQLATCQQEHPLATNNNVAAGTASADVTGGVVALDAAPSGSTGSYKATSLSDAGKWAVSTQSGEFSYSYPFTVPSVPGGLEPSPTLAYSSSSVDGQTATSNNQSSWIGNGWDLSSGFIERSYDSCYDESSAKTGDLCWAFDNATLSLGGRSTPLVPAGTNVWKQKNDDGTLVKHLFSATNDAQGGEYWEVIDTDGTRYYFGQSKTSTWTVPVFGDDVGEPCYNATFASAHCTQAYRWNLDFVVDTHGNSMTYKYATESNSYGLNRGASTVSYTRGGQLSEIDYGTRDGGSGTAPARVVFTPADRCASNCTMHDENHWPDVPWDQSCASSCASKISPTFWTTKRLSAVTTQIWNGHSYDDVDQWTLTQSNPDPGDGSGKAMWLGSIAHTGLVGTGTATVPEVTFDYADPNHMNYPNRIDSSADGLPPMDKFRIHSIHNESGGQIEVVYELSDCKRGALPAPDKNTMRCFPVHWTPDGVGEISDWFAKYVVSMVKQTDLVGDSMPQVTSYEYVGGAAWHYDDNALVPQKHRTWSEWRGYEKVRVREGDPANQPEQSLTQYQYFRGMNGDHGSTGEVDIYDSQGGKSVDSNEYAGRQREEITYNGAAVVDSTIDTPWHHGPTASQQIPTTFGPLESWTTGTSSTVTRTALTPTTSRVTQIDTTLDNYGLPTKVDDHGDLSTTEDDRCTTTSYARDTDRNLLTLPSQVTTVGVACGATPTFPQDAISDTRTYYDNGALGAKPTHGDATRTEAVKAYSGSTPQYVATDRSVYDQYGRVTSSTDALNHTTRTTYTDTFGLATQQVVSNPLDQTTTTTYDPALHQPTSVIDVRGHTTTLTYDPLGRLLTVRQPGRAPAPATPDLAFAYSVSKSSASWTRSSRLLQNGKDTSDSYTFYDGFLRARQTQSPAHGAGTIGGPQPLGRDITDTIYDSRGLVWKTSSSYFNASPPSGALQETAWTDIPQSTENHYDGAERLTDAITNHYKVEASRTSTSYHGDHVDVSYTPSNGATPTTTYTDARGQVTKLLQYHGASPTGAADTTTYGYTKAGQLTSVVDAANDRWTYGYDVLGRKTSTSDPDAGPSTLSYDDVGHLLTSTDARDQTLAYGYDALGRKTEEHSGSLSGTLLAKWRYDSLTDGTPALGNVTASTRYVDGAPYTVETTGYDDSNRPLGQKVTIPDREKGLAGSYLTKTSYLTDGSPDSSVLPALGDLPSETLSYDYDAFGQLSTMEGEDEYVSDTAYSQQNTVTLLQHGLGDSTVWNSYQHDVPTQRLTDSIIQRATGQADVDHEQYSYDAWGNVTSETDSLASSSTDRQCFDYDYLQRLSDAWTTSASDCSGAAGSSVGGPAPYWSSYAYNLLGDRTTQTQHGIGTADTVSTYHYPTSGQTHALSSITSTGASGSHTAAYGYNAAGDTISRPGPDGAAETLTWDEENHLASVSSGSSYVYDADGNRLITRDSTGSTLFVPDGELHVDKDGHSPHGTRYYLYGGLSIGVRTVSGLSWTTADSHGTSDLAINATTLQPTKRRLDPFGNARSAATFPGSQGFVGGVNDASTGLIHLGARDYDPTIGRFISVDPVIDASNPQQLNPYEYGYNNPVTTSDPTGLIGACPDGACGKVDRPGDHRSHGGMNCSSSTCVRNRQAYKKSHAPGVWGSQTRARNDQELEQNNARVNAFNRAQAVINQKIAEDAARIRQQQEEASKNHCGKLKVVCDVTGVNDVINCASHPNFGDCASAVVDIASYAVPAAKGVKLVGSGVKAADEGVQVERGLNATTAARQCLNSFPGETSVTMADGRHRAIKDIRVGERVLSTDPETGTTEARPVKKLIRHAGAHVLIEVGLADGSELTATDHHPIWDVTRQQFVDAIDLAVHDDVETIGNRSIQIRSLRAHTEDLTAYNLEIDGIHTYYAGDVTPVLTHNSCDDLPTGPGPEKWDVGTGNPASEGAAAEGEGLGESAAQDRTAEETIAQTEHQTFIPPGTEEGLSTVPGAGFAMTAAAVLAWLRRIGGG